MVAFSFCMLRVLYSFQFLATETSVSHYASIEFEEEEYIAVVLF